MKITHIKTWIVFNGFWKNWVFVKMETDEGVSGVGEATLEGKEHSVVAAIQELSNYLVGKDPTEIEHHWQVMYRGSGWKGGPILGSAISSLETCMWDILGKIAGLPVYKLLGGACRDKVHVYTHLDEPLKDKHFMNKNKNVYIPYDEVTMRMSPGEAAKRALEKVKKGYDGLKAPTLSWNPHWHTIGQIDFEAAVDTFAAIRDAVGKDVDLFMHEFSDNYNPSTAIRLAKAFEPYNPFWFEEPVPPENVDATVLVARGTTIPIATGERLFYKYGFRELLEKHACAVINPDPTHDGGMLETRKIAAMAEVYEIDVATHNPYSPLAKAINLHLATCIPNFIRLEWATPEEDGNKDIGLECLKTIGWSLKVENSWVKIPTAPGLGVELNEEVLEKYTYQPKGMGSVPPYFSRYLAYPDLSIK